MEHEILDRIGALPGVVATGFASEVPMEGPGNNGPVAVEGETPAAGSPQPGRKWRFVSPGYFEAMGTRMIAGRDVTWNDIETGGRVAVVSEKFAREIATEPAGALGKRIRLGPFAQDDWHEVIGVAQSVHENGLQEAAPSSVYWPVLAKNMFARPVVGAPSVTFAIRSERANTESLIEEIRQAVRSVSASIPIAQERTMQDYYAGSLARTSFTLVMLAIAGAMALALGLLGIYGVLAYVVSQRSREIGIRLALGAQPHEVRKMFLRHGLMLTGLGLAIGLVAALGVTRLMSSLLFGIAPTDPTAYAAALGVILAAAALASYLPARRAAAINPVETLKAE
jgi:predicted permease